jgi:hypothetical protein
MSNKFTNLSFISGSTPATVSSKLSLIELARTNTEFQNLILKLKKSGIMSVLFDSDKFRSLLTDDAIREMDKYFMDGGPSPDWIRAGENAIKQSMSDRSAEAIILNVQRKGMNKFCYDCNINVNIGTKCSETGMYHMLD